MPKKAEFHCVRLWPIDTDSTLSASQKTLYAVRPAGATVVELQGVALKEIGGDA